MTKNIDPEWLLTILHELINTIIPLFVDEQGFNTEESLRLNHFLEEIREALE